jgi:hypothetical protein
VNNALPVQVVFASGQAGSARVVRSRSVSRAPSVERQPTCGFRAPSVELLRSANPSVCTPRRERSVSVSRQASQPGTPARQASSTVPIGLTMRNPGGSYTARSLPDGSITPRSCYMNTARSASFGAMPRSLSVERGSHRVSQPIIRSQSLQSFRGGSARFCPGAMTHRDNSFPSVPGMRCIEMVSPSANGSMRMPVMSPALSRSGSASLASRAAPSQSSAFRAAPQLSAVPVPGVHTPTAPPLLGGLAIPAVPPVPHGVNPALVGQLFGLPQLPTGQTNPSGFQGMFPFARPPLSPSKASAEQVDQGPPVVPQGSSSKLCKMTPPTPSPDIAWTWGAAQDEGGSGMNTTMSSTMNDNMPAKLVHL